MKPLNALGKEIHAISTRKGFKPPSRRNIDQKLMLVVSELCEAQDELRNGHRISEIYFKGTKPEGFPVEYADALIRLLHIGHSLGIDIDAVVALKVNYNRSRPYKHGRKF